MKSRAVPSVISDDQYILNFGAHEGRRILEVLNLAPDYLVWTIENDVLTFSDDLRETIYQCATSQLQDEMDADSMAGSIWEYTGDDD